MSIKVMIDMAGRAVAITQSTEGVLKKNKHPLQALLRVAENNSVKYPKLQ
jgi:hypothetical protein